MPPKAKVRAKAKARGGALRRRAAVVGPRRIRRPAARGDETPWGQGQEVPLHQVSPVDLQPGCWLAVTEGDYFGEQVKLACEVTKLEMEHGETTLVVKPKGTDSEAILKVHTAHPQQSFRCHVCPPGCGRQDVGEFKLHASKGRKVNREGDEAWTNNLEVVDPGADGRGGEDENADLRRRAALLRPEHPGGQAMQPEREGGVALPGEEDKAEETKKKKKKKEKKKEKNLLDGRHPAQAGQKEVKEIYGGTAMDPREKVRRRVLAKAQKFVASKKVRSSSGSSSESSTSSSSLEARGLTTVFAEETKIRGVAERFPGALAMESMVAMRRSLLTTSGEEADETSLKPVALLYFRSVLAKRANGPQSREMLNLSTVLDLLVRGRIASAADVVAQRLKAQEAVTQGTHWAVAQRMEIPPSEAEGIAARTELRHAQKEDYADAQARWRAQSSGGGRGDGKGKNKGQKGEAWKKEERKDEPAKKGKGKEKK
eukprot:s239_g10.t1